MSSVDSIPQSSRVTILSNIVLNSCENQVHNETVSSTKVVNAESKNNLETSPPYFEQHSCLLENNNPDSQQFRNPKRTSVFNLDFSELNQTHPNIPKRKAEADDIRHQEKIIIKDDVDIFGTSELSYEKQEIEKGVTFNYLTGTYETLPNLVNNHMLDDCSKFKEEITVEEHAVTHEDIESKPKDVNIINQSKNNYALKNICIVDLTTEDTDNKNELKPLDTKYKVGDKVCNSISLLENNITNNNVDDQNTKILSDPPSSTKISKPVSVPFLCVNNSSGSFISQVVLKKSTLEEECRAKDALNKDSVVQNTLQRKKPIPEIVSQSANPIPFKSNDYTKNKHFICNTCLFQANSKNDLITHIYKEHLEKDFELALKCSSCSFESCSSEEMDKHICSSQKPDSSARQNNQVQNSPILSENSENAMIFKCFDCHFSTSLKRILTAHCLKHPGSKFKCMEHQVESKDCIQCIYQTCVIASKSQIQTCEKCGFKTCDGNVLILHKKSSRGCGLPTADEAQKQKFTYSQKNNYFKRKKKRKRCESEFYVDDYENGSKNLSKSRVFNHSSKQRRGERSDCEFSDSDSDVEVKNMLQCFHCEYQTKSRDLLKFHTIKHYNCIYECDIHLYITRRNCNKCIYKSILLELKNEVLLCQECGFKTLRQLTFDRHKSKAENCKIFEDKVEEISVDSDDSSEFDVGVEFTHKTTKQLEKSSVVSNKDKRESLNDKTLSLKCVACNFLCTSEQHLKNHSILHISDLGKSTFYCFDHSKYKNNQNCEKCVFEHFLSTIEKEILVCFSCGYKCFDQIFFNLHHNWHEQQRKTPDSRDEISDEYEKNGRKCLPCNVSFISVEHFKNHILLHLSNSSTNFYDCLDHPKNKDNSCRTCIYASRMKIIECKVLVCPICQFKCFNKSYFELHFKWHEESEDKNDNLLIINNVIINKDTEQLKNISSKNSFYRCHDCEYRGNGTTYHKVLDNKANLSCNEHVGQIQINCKQCYFEHVTKDLFFQQLYNCFDCKSSDFLPLSEIIPHVRSKHKDSKYKCDHENFLANCIQCCYEQVVKIDINLYFCYMCCCFKTHSEDSLIKHIKHNHKKSEYTCNWHNITNANCCKCVYARIAKSRYFICFDCDFITCNKNELQQHAKENHNDSKYQCSKHTLGDIDEDCNMCIYENAVVFAYEGEYLFKK